jgi:hypothetical protein
MSLLRDRYEVWRDVLFKFAILLLVPFAFSANNPEFEKETLSCGKRREQELWRATKLADREFRVGCQNLSGYFSFKS